MMSDIEETQCVTCTWRKNPAGDGQHAIDYPMCYEVEGLIVEHENVIDPLDEDEFGQVYCTRYKHRIDLSEPQPPEQEKLF
jgi:hypothetical protein